MAELNRRHLLRSRPEGRIDEGNFELVEEDAPEPAEGQALVRNLYLSLDPTNRIWASEMDSYLPPVELGTVMRGMGLGEVVSSRTPDYPEGTLVSGMIGWQDYTLADPGAAYPLMALPDELPAPLPAMAGALGMTGATAYFGMTEIGQPKEGETVVVSAAAGAVGSVAGQIAKAMGARVVGIAGSDEKVEWITGELGFDAAVKHSDDDWRDQLASACPDGVDVDFENVGGEIMDHLFTMLNLHSRVVLCGLVSQYNDDEPWGPVNFPQLLMRRVRLQGFIILDYFDRFGEAFEQLGEWLADGTIKHEETIVEGLEQAPSALDQLFEGGNRGKLLVRIAEPSSH